MCVARKLNIQLSFDGPGMNQSVKFLLFLMAGFHNIVFNLSNL